MAEQLLHRFIQAHLRIKEYAFLIKRTLFGVGQAGMGRAIEAAIVHGTLTIGFIGWLRPWSPVGSTSWEKQEAQELGLEIGPNRAFTDRMSEETNLNFSCWQRRRKACQQVCQPRSGYYGLLPGITDMNTTQIPFIYRSASGGATKISLKDPI